MQIFGEEGMRKATKLTLYSTLTPVKSSEIISCDQGSRKINQNI